MVSTQKGFSPRGGRAQLSAALGGRCWMPGLQATHEPLQGQCSSCHLTDGETEAQRDEVTCPSPTADLAFPLLHCCVSTGVMLAWFRG